MDMIVEHMKNWDLEEFLQGNLIVDKSRETIDKEIAYAYDNSVINNYYSQSNTCSVKLAFDIPPSLWRSDFKK